MKRGQGGLAARAWRAGTRSRTRSAPCARTTTSGVRYMTLTHSATLDWADSATDDPAPRRPHPLRRGGRARDEPARHARRPLARAREETMEDALRVSEAPVIFSHSSARALCDHPRNVPDAVLAKLPANGGVVMVTFVAAFVSQEFAKASAPAVEGVRGRARRGSRTRRSASASTRRSAAPHAEDQGHDRPGGRPRRPRAQGRGRRPRRPRRRLRRQRPRGPRASRTCRATRGSSPSSSAAAGATPTSRSSRSGNILRVMRAGRGGGPAPAAARPPSTATIESLDGPTPAHRVSAAVSPLPEGDDRDRDHAAGPARGAAARRRRPVVPPGPGEVLVRVAAAGVNRPDLMQREGKYPPPPGASRHPRPRGGGHGGRRGRGRHRPGARATTVCALVAGGGYAEYCARARRPSACPVPRGLSLVRGGGAARDLLHRLDQRLRARPPRRRRDPARPRRSERHRHDRDPAGARLRRARVFATAGTAEKCAACVAPRRRAGDRLPAARTSWRWRRPPRAGAGSTSSSTWWAASYIAAEPRLPGPRRPARPDRLPGQGRRPSWTCARCCRSA